MHSSTRLVDVPDTFIASYGAHGPGERAWLARLPRLGAAFLDRWGLRPDGPSAHGMASLVLPVVRHDGTPAVLRLQQVREETAGTAAGLRAWNGDGVVRLLEHDEPTGTQLLERLDAARPLSSVEDDDTATAVLGGLLARLTAVPAPPGLRRLSDIAGAMLDDVPAALAALPAPEGREVVRGCAAAVAELLGDAGGAGDRLLHWDLHHDNVLAGEREPWLAIDPEPLAGDPGFDLLPALDNRWDAVVATGDVTRAVLRRFDLLTELLGLERDRAAGWTLGRVLQNVLWDVEDGKETPDPVQTAVAEAMSLRRT
ncbi:aminoglycoside phosphotransferase family protein [Streptomyces caatingaensis]|uniref:Hydroxyurea phosphotransferase n=1 Tax=Streptomyces caatingaensis TaxID=1678637 RepID=A0A0K9XI10_9ACTN|nr:aminoglycoside phosphotransferase family protein [Streptomyces caatingaensis]KNB52297.1 hydroxyurea phosphotransferase [Streptomyces caatingaensis]